MPKVMAWEQLHDPEYSSQLTMGQFKKLLLRAGYSENTAHRAAMERGWERLSAGAVM